MPSPSAIPPISGSFPAAPPFFSEAVEACLAVFQRLGAEGPESVFPVSLRRELRERGLKVEGDGFSRNLESRFRNVFASESNFDLVIEGAFPIVLGCGEESRVAFEQQLRRAGFSAGLMVDVSASEFLTEGFRLVRVRNGVRDYPAFSRN